MTGSDIANQAASGGAGAVRSDWAAQKGRAPGLDGLSGKIRLVASGAPVGVLMVEDGDVFIEPHGDASTLLETDTVATLVSLLGGGLHPIVARLQGRAWLQGDVALGVRIFFGLRADSPWRSLTPRSDADGPRNDQHP
jgi:hypothetical protein